MKRAHTRFHNVSGLMVGATIAGLLVQGCEGMNKLESGLMGGGIGAAGGAGVGYLIAGERGAVIGGLIGAATGAAIGVAVFNAKQRRAEEAEKQRAEAAAREITAKMSETEDGRKALDQMQRDNRKLAVKDVKTGDHLIVDPVECKVVTDSKTGDAVAYTLDEPSKQSVQKQAASGRSAVGKLDEHDVIFVSPAAGT
ncbi:MAG: hypothetical protein ACOYN0_03195 [Phycisphaerales bacterium]